jgi:hypothetical protein
MTGAEIEAELGSLRGRLLQLEQEQDSRKKASGRLGRASLALLLFYLALGFGSIAVDVWFHISGVPPLYTTYANVFVLVLPPLTILTLALLLGHTLWRGHQVSV